MSNIPAFRYHFPDHEIDAITNQFHSVLTNRRFLTDGDFVADFEERFAEYTHSTHAISMSSGTSSLEAILRYIGVDKKKVIVPTNTFAATAFAVLHAGGVPFFVDCDNDLAINPDQVEAVLTSEVAAIIAVHIGGMISTNLPKLLDLATVKGIPVIEDAAHAHGSWFQGKHAGTFGTAGAFSFFSTKVMTTGEGGMVVTDNDELASYVRLVRDQAKQQGKNVHYEIGFNWRMSEFQAILGLSQLRTLEETIGKRTAIAKQYYANLNGLGAITPLQISSASRPNFYKWIAFTQPSMVDKLRYRLKTDHGISLGGSVFDIPCHNQPAFEEFRANSLGIAEALCPGHFCPPVFHDMEEEDTNRVSAAIWEILK